MLNAWIELALVRRLALAVFLAGFIGIEREMRQKDAGPSTDGIMLTYEDEAMPGAAHVYLHTITFEPRGARTLLRQHTVRQTVESATSTPGLAWRRVSTPP